MVLKIGIGLPNSVRGTTGQALIEVARRADERGFSTLTTIGRVAFPSFDELLVFAAAAAVTRRVSLLPGMLLGPTRDPVLLAKEILSLDQLSGGRFLIGLAVGGREDDFVAVGRDFHDRGKRLDEQVDIIRKAWAGEPVGGTLQPIGPAPVHGGMPPFIFGGQSDAAIARTVRWGLGWMAGGAGPERTGAFGARVRQAWKEAGRPGAPRIIGLQYFALGSDAAAGAAAYVNDYYAFLGQWAAGILQSMPMSAEAIRGVLQPYEDAGVDEVIFGMTIGDPAQVDLLADALHPGGA